MVFVIVLLACSSSLNNYAKEFVCSVVVGKDLVPRLGLATIQKLKEKMISLAWQSNQPKVGSQP